MTDFITLDNGERAEYDSGMVRDTDAGKPRYDLMIPLGVEHSEVQVNQLGTLLDLDVRSIDQSWSLLSGFLKWWHDEDTATNLFSMMVHRDGPLLQRFAELMGRGAEKYDARNWEKANGPEELDRFRQSAFRHFVQYLRGDTDEDHAAAVVFNVRAHDWLKDKLASDPYGGYGYDHPMSEDGYTGPYYWKSLFGGMRECTCGPDDGTFMRDRLCQYDTAMPCIYNKDGNRVR